MASSHNQRFNDLTGHVFGRLTVISLIGTIKRQRQWKCMCIEGNLINVFAGHLIQGHSQSCGCLRKERVSLSLSKGGGPVKSARMKNGFKSQKDFAQLIGCSKQTISKCEVKNRVPRNHSIKRAIHKTRPPEDDAFRVIQAELCGYCRMAFTVSKGAATNQRHKRSKSGLIFCSRQCSLSYKNRGPKPYTDTTLKPETVAKFNPRTRDKSKADKWIGAKKTMIKKATQ
jgi:DNA-binding XRE family transcriptional regulator